MKKMYLLGFVLGMLTASSAIAQQAYSYVGQPFAILGIESDIAGNPDYTNSDRVSGTITFSNPLAPNLVAASPIVLLYSFSDGVNTYTNYNSNLFFLSVNTDASGNIENNSVFVIEQILKANYYNGILINTTTISPITPNLGDEAFNNLPFSLIPDATTSDGGTGTVPGVWITDAPAPALGVWSLIGFTVLLAGIGYIVVRRQDIGDRGGMRPKG